MTTPGDLRALINARQTRRAQLALAARLGTARLWRRLDPHRLTQSWDAQIGRDLLLIVAAAQAKAAQGSDFYVATALGLQGFASDPDGAMVAESVAGIASDGRALASLLYQPVITTKSWLGDGMSLGEALDGGLRQLQMIVETQITDAGRVADGVSTVANRRSRGYVRVLTPPSCARCAVLAGNVYASEKPFERHPRCDCQHVPVGDTDTGKSMARSPRDYFNSLAAHEQNRIFTVAGAEAIRDGADIAQVVNARRGMYSASSGLRYTTEGMSRRGLARRGLVAASGGRFLAPVRLMPEAIYDIASNREEVLRLLRRFGYIT